MHAVVVGSLILSGLILIVLAIVWLIARAHVVGEDGTRLYVRPWVKGIVFVLFLHLAAVCFMVASIGVPR